MKSLSEILSPLVSISQPETEVINFKSEQEINGYLASEFPDVEPTLRDLYIGRLLAYQRASARRQQEDKATRERARREAAMRMPTIEEMEKHALTVGRAIAAAEGFKNGFVIDDDNREVFKLLCQYFCNDPEFEKSGIDGKSYSLNKGIWLQSSQRGSGKSTLLKCFQVNKRSCFAYKHTTELTNLYQKRGFDGIDMFIGLIPQPSHASNFYQAHAGVMFDELFGESKANYMGTPLLVSEYIINRLYDFSDNLKGQMWKFHVTSNATGEDIEQISGKTYRSRMPDMFNLIKLEGPNRRI